MVGNVQSLDTIVSVGAKIRRNRRAIKRARDENLAMIATVILKRCNKYIL